MNGPGDRRSALLPRRLRAGPRGFTLVETLLVLAVIALLGALVLPGIGSLMRTINNEEPDRLFWDAVTAAREQALRTGRTVLMRFDAEKKLLAWSDDAGGSRTELTVGAGLQFLQPREGSTILLGGVLVETQEVPAVRFYPDGTCDRFRVQIRRGTGARQLIAVDPWTCAPMIEAGRDER